MSKEIIFNENARGALKNGIDILAEAVSMTLGPRGRAVVIEKEYGPPQVTFDGVTVAREVKLPNEFSNLGAEFLKQVANKTNDNVGDGTSTSVVLAHAMISEGEKAISEKGFNVIRLAEGLKKGSEDIIRALESQSELINDPKKIKEVATLSAKDEQIGTLIAEVFKKVGKDGVVTIEDSNTVGNSYDIVDGMQLDKGYISQYMVTNPEKMESVLDNPYILVTDKKISALGELVPIIEKMMQFNRKDLLIIADNVDGEALSMLVLNKIRGIFNGIAIKAPGFGDRKKEMLQDIAALTGATLISDDYGKKLDSVELLDLGQATRVISTKDNTTIVGGKGDKKATEAIVSQLKSRINKAESEFDKDGLKERIGKLSGGVAVIKVGSPTESAQKELKQRVEDAVHATRAAMEEGIVPGGGIALFNAGLMLSLKDKKGEVEEEAALILGFAIEAPLIAIIRNSGEDAIGIIENLIAKKEKGGIWIGFNAIKNKIGDLKEAGIIDPLKVTKTAFINAVSVAANYLTIGAAMIERSQDKNKEQFR